MLVPQNSPCPECSHPRGDHDIRFAAGGGEQCKHCGCTATTIRTDPIFWNPDAPPKPFDWNFALVTFLMELEGDEGLFTDTIERWRPGYELAAGEREELRSLELLVRELWARYSPREPLRADVHGRPSTPAHHRPRRHYRLGARELRRGLIDPDPQRAAALVSHEVAIPEWTPAEAEAVRPGCIEPVPVVDDRAAALAPAGGPSMKAKA
jgi:hypothetical protein